MESPYPFNQVEAKILMIDDTRTNLLFLEEALGDSYKNIYTANDGREGLEIARKILPDIILTDIVMPQMDGFQCIQALKEDPLTREIPVVFLSTLDKTDTKTKGFSLGAVDYITKPFEAAEVKARVDMHLTLKFAHQKLTYQNEYLETLVAERTEELALTQEATIAALASLAETRDNETGNHIQRTKNYIQYLALTLRDRGIYRDQLDNKTIKILTSVAPLHDIGKVGVPDRILLKPGKLTEEEFTEMKNHTIYGFNALDRAESRIGNTPFLSLAKEVAISHHEKWDGTGYPKGLKGENIPLSGRLMAIADVYDALISERIYKAPIPHSEAVQIIARGKGTQFDPQIVKAFMDIHEQIRQIALKNVESDEEREALQK